MDSMINALLGIAVLLFGRKLFWLFVGVAGFVFGLTLAASLLDGQPDGVVLLVALAAGVLGAALAIVAQQIAIAVAGFVFGGYTLISLLNTIGLDAGQWLWLLFITGGVIGVILVVMLFDPALIVLSSLAGAVLISQTLNLDAPLDLLLFVILFIVGLIVQAGMLKRGRSRPRSTEVGRGR